MSFFEPIASERVTHLPNPVEFKAITLPRNHPTLPDDGAVIRIHLDTWSTVFEESIMSRIVYVQYAVLYYIYDIPNHLRDPQHLDSCP